MLIGTHNHGQGHETTFAQIVSEKLGVAFDNVDIVFGDTDRVQFGMGTYGSRSLVVGGAALSKASDKVVAEGQEDRGASAREPASRISSSRPGCFRLREPTAARRSRRSPALPMCRTTIHSRCSSPDWRSRPITIRSISPIPAAVHIAEVEIDPETGIVTLEKYTAVDDVGTVINPMIVEGQLHGGIVQGVGQALYENCRL